MRTGPMARVAIGVLEAVDCDGVQSVLPSAYD